jgi:ABC-type oligopeptide transport system substrate-binding subunit
MKKKFLTVLLVLAPLALVGCKNYHKAEGSVTVCIASAPTTIDPSTNSTVDGGTYDEHLFEGLYRWSYTGDYPNGTVSLVPGLAKAAPDVVTNADKTVTYTYTLRDGLKWSDGSALTAHDFERSWKRAVSGDEGDSKGLGSDYGYLFEAIKGGAEAEGEADGRDLAVSATDDTHLVVTLVNAVPYWDELTAFPTFAPVPTSADLDGSWVSPENIGGFVCNGPMMIKAYDSTKLEMVPNPNYYNQDIVNCADLVFAFSDDADAMFNSFQTNSYDFIDDLPVAQIDTLKANDPNEFFNVCQLGTYYYSWNVNMTGNLVTKFDTEAKREMLRHAIALCINRQYIIDNVAKGGQAPAAGFVSSGLLDADGKSDWTAHNGVKQDGTGWYDVKASAQDSNVQQAIQVLKDAGCAYDAASGKFTDVPTITFLTNVSKGHVGIAQVLQDTLKNIGITLTIDQQEWNTYTQTRKKGDYIFSRNGWLCDYNDPISELDMWTSGSGNNDCQLGKGDNASYKGYEVDLDGDGVISAAEKNLTWGESYDAIIAKIKTTTDKELRYKLMHAAETELMSTWAVTPIYYYTDLFLKKESLKGFFAMPLGYKFFYGCSGSVVENSSAAQ